MSCCPQRDIVAVDDDVEDLPRPDRDQGDLVASGALGPALGDSDAPLEVANRSALGLEGAHGDYATTLDTSVVDSDRGDVAGEIDRHRDADRIAGHCNRSR